MSKKGFTLIELLAVIVILAIILLIAMPIVLNVINEARRGAFDSTAYGIVKTAENQYMRSALDGETERTWYEFTTVDNVTTQTVYRCTDAACATTTAAPTAEKLEFTGRAPTSGTVYVNNDGEIALFLTDGTWCSTKALDATTVLTPDPAAPDPCTLAAAVRPEL